MFRPYLNGWHDNPALPQGMVYEGVDRFADRPIAMRGQTGAHSSIVPAMVALFGVSHERDELRTFLEDLHRYRLPPHRRSEERRVGSKCVGRCSARCGTYTYK